MADAKRIVAHGGLVRLTYKTALGALNPDLAVRNRLLYPSELRPHSGILSREICT